MPVWAPRPEWLSEAVEAVLGQSERAIELIVVDDGCEPPVADLMSEVEDERMRIVRVPHGRVSRARNAGIELAKGAWFRYVDCDDVIAPDSTEHLLEIADGDDGVIAYGSTVVCDEYLRPLSTVSTSHDGRVAELCLLNRFETTIHSLLFPRRIVEQVGPWEPSLVVSQDWDYALRAFEQAEVRGDRRVATYYRTHSGMNSGDVRRGIDGYRQVVERYFERNPEQSGSALERRARAGFHLFAATQSATRLREPGAAFHHLRQALACGPTAAVGALRQQGMPLDPAGGSVRRLLRRPVG
jgi:glycosyltransferase involved in cell wall biosynthesis